MTIHEHQTVIFQHRVETAYRLTKICNHVVSIRPNAFFSCIKNWDGRGGDLICTLGAGTCINLFRRRKKNMTFWGVVRLVPPLNKNLLDVIRHDVQIDRPQMVIRSLLCCACTRTMTSEKRYRVQVEEDLPRADHNWTNYKCVTSVKRNMWDKEANLNSKLLSAKLRSHSMSTYKVRR